MKVSVNRVLMGFGLLAGLSMGIGYTGGGIALVLAGAAGAWMIFAWEIDFGAF